MCPLVFAVLPALPLPLRGDVFVQRSVLFGEALMAETSCALNPVHTSFSPDGKRLRLVWERLVLNYTGAMITTYDGRVVAQDDTSIANQRDTETLRTGHGSLGLCQMRKTLGPDGALMM